MKKTSRIVMFAIAIALVTQISVTAAPISNQAQTQQNQLEQNKNSLKEAQAKREKLESSIEKLDSKIEDYMMKIEANKKNITLTENVILNTEKQIIQVEEQVKDKQDALDQRVRAIYINGQSSYLKILLESESFSDLITRAEAIRKIVGMDKKIISDLNEKRLEVEDKKVSIEKKYDDLLALKNENEDKLVSLNTNMEDQKKLIEEAKTQEKLYSSRVDESQALVNATMKEINRIRSEAPKAIVYRGTTSVATSGSSNNLEASVSASNNNVVAPVSNNNVEASTSASNNSVKASTSNKNVKAAASNSNNKAAAPVAASSNNVIAYASNFLGIPYLWGGTSPSTGFDCSGFTQYVYAHFGIRVGRTTYDQIKDGVGVSRGELKAGDLVFFGDDGNPTHMGIYVGNNTYIHSPRTGDVLKISPMTRTDYITARRVM